MNILRPLLPLFFACYALGGHGFAADVLTYHNDNQRTGWNSQEATLTPLNVNGRAALYSLGFMMRRAAAVLLKEIQLRLRSKRMPMAGRGASTWQ